LQVNNPLFPNSNSIRYNQIQTDQEKNANNNDQN
jgi:hypothetical protein